MHHVLTGTQDSWTYLEKILCVREGVPSGLLGCGKRRKLWAGGAGGAGGQGLKMLTLHLQIHRRCQSDSLLSKSMADDFTWSDVLILSLILNFFGQHTPVSQLS